MSALVKTDLKWLEFFEHKQACLDADQTTVTMSWGAMCALNNLSGDCIRGLPELVPGTNLYMITASTFILAVDSARRLYEQQVVEELLR